MAEYQLTGTSNDEDGKVPASCTNDLVKVIESQDGKQNKEDDCSHERGRIAV